MSKKKSALREWVDAIIIAAALAIFLRTFLGLETEREEAKSDKVVIFDMI